MSFRFWRRVKIAPGVTLNLSKSGGSVSVGPRGAKVTVGPRGSRATVGIPGTGLFYTKSLSKKSSAKTSAPSISAKDRLSLGFFQKLFTPDDEKSLVEGCRELLFGSEEKALKHLEKSTHMADGAYLAGFVALKKNRLDDAVRYLSSAVKNHHHLGHYFSKYRISATMSLPITRDISADIQPDIRGVLLGLVEVYQLQENWPMAMECLEQLMEIEPDDVVIRLSLAEILMTTRQDDREACHRVVKLTAKMENESPVHGALMLYKAMALQQLGMTTAARDTLTQALRRKKDRPANLLLSLMYQRAKVYEELGEKAKARKEFEKIYAQNPEFEDVREIMFDGD